MRRRSGTSVKRPGWGTADAFDRSSRLLASALPPERVYTHPGGHDWQAWESLWEASLDRAEPCRGRG